MEIRNQMKSQERRIEEYHITKEPYYLPIKDEVDLFRAAFLSKIPVLLKGPTGTGKTRFIEYMAYTLESELNSGGDPDNTTFPLITCPHFHVLPSLPSHVSPLHIFHIPTCLPQYLSTVPRLAVPPFHFLH